MIGIIVRETVVEMVGEQRVVVSRMYNLTEVTLL